MTAETVFHFTDSGEFGGAEHALALLLRHLDPDRWRSTLLHHDLPGIEPLVRRAAELDVPALAVRPLPLGLEGALRVPGFARRLAGLRPTVFHAHQTDPLACKYAIASAIVARVPVIVVTTQLFVEIGAVAQFQQRVLARGIDRWVGVSEATGLRLIRMLGRRGDRVSVVPNGIDPDRLDVPCEPAVRARLAGPRDEPVVLAVGRLTEQKGFSYLLDCVDRVPGVRFVIAGDGPERASLERQAAGAGDRVEFLGARTDVPALLACCDVFVLPSLYEGLPLAILEAMAAGKPVIATDVDGNGEAVADGHTGLLVPPRDVDALATAIRRVAGDPELGRTLGENGRARVHARFTAAGTARRIAAIYEQGLRGARG